MSKTKINKNKQKKIFKKTKKNRQYSAGELEEKKEPKEKKDEKKEQEKEEKDEDGLKEKITGMLSSTGEFIGEKALRLVGVKEEEEIGKDEEEKGK
jgi:hypothetical protein